ncbi:hypothetical protein LK486_17290, partial [Fusicatenibacter saccharivorans]|nr:hypothetical protein [Fusicatenibacter saccharivorans]
MRSQGDRTVGVESRGDGVTEDFRCGRTDRTNQGHNSGTARTIVSACESGYRTFGSQTCSAKIGHDLFTVNTAAGGGAS